MPSLLKSALPTNISYIMSPILHDLKNAMCFKMIDNNCTLCLYF